MRLTATGLRPHLRLRVTGSGERRGACRRAAGGGENPGPPRRDPGRADPERRHVAADQAGGASSGWLVAAGNPQLAAHLRRAVCAGVEAPEATTVLPAQSLLMRRMRGLLGPAALDAPLATADLDTCTVLAGIQVGAMSASNCLLAGLVEARRRQGCVRFSYLPLASATAPRRHHCLPEPQGPPGRFRRPPRPTRRPRASASWPRAVRGRHRHRRRRRGLSWAPSMSCTRSWRLANLSSQLDQTRALVEAVFFET